MKAIAPNGLEIIGTADLIPGTSLILHDGFTQREDGSLEVEWHGETKVHWGGQCTKQNNGKNIYVDEHGNEWAEDQLKLVPAG